MKYILETESEDTVHRFRFTVKLNSNEEGCTNKSLKHDYEKAGPLAQVIIQVLESLSGRIKFWFFMPYELTIQKTPSVEWGGIDTTLGLALDKAIQEKTETVKAGRK